MTRLQLFLIVDGVIVAGGLLFFVILFLRRGNAGHFKDDLWQHPPKTPQEAEERRKIEQKVDQLLLGHDVEGESAAEPASAGGKKEGASARPIPSKRPEFQLPNFRGQPHEVLGVPAGADADLIARAYKHWIKRYHPDRVHHLGVQYVNQARRRAEQLNSARQAMVQRLAQRAK